MGQATSPQASTLGWRNPSPDTPGLGWTCFCSRTSGSHRGCASWDRAPWPDEAPSLRLRLVHHRGQALLLGAAGLFSTRGGLCARASPTLTGPPSDVRSPRGGHKAPSGYLCFTAESLEVGTRTKDTWVSGHSPSSVRSDSFKLEFMNVHFISI